MSKSNKPPQPKKAELVTALQDLLSEEHWDLIHQLVGREIGGPRRDLGKARFNFLSGLFHKTIKIGSRKGKARRLQKWMEARIGELLGEPCGKDTGICSREMGQTGPDVALSPRVRELFRFTVECKSGDGWDIPGAIRQCQANLYPGTEWLLVLDRPDNSSKRRVPPVICMDGEKFFELLKGKL